MSRRTYSEDELHSFQGIWTAKVMLSRIGDSAARAEADLSWSCGLLKDGDKKDRIKTLARRILMVEREAGNIYAELDRLRREVEE
jgi:hypothetical protein